MAKLCLSCRARTPRARGNTTAACPEGGVDGLPNTVKTGALPIPMTTTWTATMSQRAWRALQAVPPAMATAVALTRPPAPPLPYPPSSAADQGAQLQRARERIAGYQLPGPLPAGGDLLQPDTQRHTQLTVDAHPLAGDRLLRQRQPGRLQLPGPTDRPDPHSQRQGEHQY